MSVSNACLLILRAGAPLRAELKKLYKLPRDPGFARIRAVARPANNRHTPINILVPST